jgi:hypothetical protein
MTNLTSLTAIDPPVEPTPAAQPGATLLTLVAISFAAMGLWRIGADLDCAGDFVFQSGLLSHWQVWIAAAFGVQHAQYRFSTWFGDRLLKALRQMRKVWNAVLIFPACSTSRPLVAGPHEFLNVFTTTTRTNRIREPRIRRDQGGGRASSGLRRMGVLHARNR